MEKLKYYKTKYGDIHYKLQLLKDVQKFQDLYADLYFFEVYLKYNINEEFSKHFGTDWKADIRFWKSKDKHKKFTENNEITLGFWVALFNTRINQYDGKIKIKNIFKDINLGFNKIYTELKDIRDFRNAIFHFNAETYIDEIPKYKKLIQKYIVSLSCDDVFLNRNEIDIYSHTVFNYIKKIQNVKIIDCNILDFIEINILFEYNGLEIIIIYYNISDFGELGIKYCIDDDIYNFFDADSDKTKIMKIKNKPLCDFIRIVIFDIFDDFDYYKDEISSYADDYVDNKTKFITTLEELPNLLNKIANDNAN